jgi:hypothetical protein
MGKWDVIIEGEFDGHLVVVETRRTDFAAKIGQDGEPAVRVTITCLRDCDVAPERIASGRPGTASGDRAGALIAFEADTFEGLEGGLIEVGFSTEAATLIASRVSHRPWHASLG